MINGASGKINFQSCVDGDQVAILLIYTNLKCLDKGWKE